MKHSVSIEQDRHSNRSQITGNHGGELMEKIGFLDLKPQRTQLKFEGLMAWFVI